MAIRGLLVFRKGLNLDGVADAGGSASSGRTLEAASPHQYSREEANLMDQCVIVSGDDALATTIVDELKRAGARVTRLLDSDLAGARVKTELVQAGVAHAVAVV